MTEWLPYWENELGARDVSPRTVTNQRKTLARLVRDLGDVPPETLTPERLLEWRDDMRGALMDSSVNCYLLTVGTFLNWLASEGVLTESPMLYVPLLKVREVSAPPVFDAGAMRRLAKGAAVVKQGRSRFEALRDQAMLSLLADSGLRASECAGLLVGNVNMPARQVYVHGAVAKGRKSRTVAFGFQTARLLNKYLRERERHAYAFLPQLFLGRKGAATYTVVRDAVRKAGLREGVIGARPHLLRHTWAHDLKSQGVDTEVLMSLGGWSTTAMPMRYGRAEKVARAHAAYRKVGSPVDRRHSA